MNAKPPKRDVVVIAGPTASGKSDLALHLAESERGEIVNADSVQIYRGFDIGSAKPSPGDCQRVPHHLLSLLDPEEEFNAGRFCAMAGTVIDDLGRRGVLPVIVGGTGLYIRALLCGLVATGEGMAGEWKEHEDELRARASSEDEFRTQMHRWLSELDPLTASRLQPRDLPRIRRALQVVLSSGISLAQLQDEHRNAQQLYRALIVVLLPERHELYTRIDERVERMLELGLVREVECLKSLHPAGGKAFSAIGYRHVRQYLDGAIDYRLMVDEIKADTRRFAKRQFTWWRNQPRLLGWSDVTERADVARKKAGGIELVRTVLERFRARRESAEGFESDGIFVLRIRPPGLETDSAKLKHG